ncbi:unnamed protein product [Microthlaspi erraticum]|uniref:F-box domain-containing protein n=1 Tax=Microthlaspi erraticum TaxID=1685480 RepID=A0A6D2HJ91_9BRAS|nr:unnamed protein product [Microthlaspi erraticum]
MDKEQEEKRGEIQRATHDDDDDRSEDSQLDHIPFDLTLEILLRLPAKSLVRFRCVSKLCSSLTTLPSFINSFRSRSSARPPRLLFTFVIETKRFVFSFPQHHNHDGSNPPFYSYQTTNPSFMAYNGPNTLSGSVHGLVLLAGFKIWNPSFTRFLTLPHPIENISSDKYRSYIGIGYDPLEDKHKVLFVSFFEHFEQPQVLTLGAKESWRTIPKSCPEHYPPYGGGRCVNGILYYEARVVGVDHDLIMSFDVTSEKFNHPIKFPNTNFRSERSRMSSYEGKLALVQTSYPFGYIGLYVLEDAVGDEWTHKWFCDVNCNREWRRYILFQGITDAGELIFAPCGWHESFFILYFDPRTKRIREALFEGMMSEEIKHSYNHSKYDTLFNLQVFPNHIESLLL